MNPIFLNILLLTVLLDDNVNCAFRKALFNPLISNTVVKASQNITYPEYEHSGQKVKQVEMIIPKTNFPLSLAAFNIPSNFSIGKQNNNPKLGQVDLDRFNKMFKDELAKECEQGKAESSEDEDQSEAESNAENTESNEESESEVEEFPPRHVPIMIKNGRLYQLGKEGDDENSSSDADKTELMAGTTPKITDYSPKLTITEKTGVATVPSEEVGELATERVVTTLPEQGIEHVSGPITAIPDQNTSSHVASLIENTGTAEVSPSEQPQCVDPIDNGVNAESSVEDASPVISASDNSVEEIVSHEEDTSPESVDNDSELDTDEVEATISESIVESDGEQEQDLEPGAEPEPGVPLVVPEPVVVLPSETEVGHHENQEISAAAPIDNSEQSEFFQEGGSGEVEEGRTPSDISQIEAESNVLAADLQTYSAVDEQVADTLSLPSTIMNPSDNNDEKENEDSLVNPGNNGMVDSVDVLTEAAEPKELNSSESKTVPESQVEQEQAHVDHLRVPEEVEEEDYLSENYDTNDFNELSDKESEQNEFSEIETDLEYGESEEEEFVIPKQETEMELKSVNIAPFKLDDEDIKIEITKSEESLVTKELGKSEEPADLLPVDEAEHTQSKVDEKANLVVESDSDSDSDQGERQEKYSTFAVAIKESFDRIKSEESEPDSESIGENELSDLSREEATQFSDNERGYDSENEIEKLEVQSLSDDDELSIAGDNIEFIRVDNTVNEPLELENHIDVTADSEEVASKLDSESDSKVEDSDEEITVDEPTEQVVHWKSASRKSRDTTREKADYESDEGSKNPTESESAKVTPQTFNELSDEESNNGDYSKIETDLNSVVSDHEELVVPKQEAKNPSKLVEDESESESTKLTRTTASSEPARQDTKLSLTADIDPLEQESAKAYNVLILNENENSGAGNESKIETGFPEPIKPTETLNPVVEPGHQGYTEEAVRNGIYEPITRSKSGGNVPVTDANNGSEDGLTEQQRAKAETTISAEIVDPQDHYEENVINTETNVRDSIEGDLYVKVLENILCSQPERELDESIQSKTTYDDSSNNGLEPTNQDENVAEKQSEFVIIPVEAEKQSSLKNDFTEKGICAEESSDQGSTEKESINSGDQETTEKQSELETFDGSEEGEKGIDEKRSEDEPGGTNDYPADDRDSIAAIDSGDESSLGSESVYDADDGLGSSEDEESDIDNDPNSFEYESEDEYSFIDEQNSLANEYEESSDEVKSEAEYDTDNENSDKESVAKEQGLTDENGVDEPANDERLEEDSVADRDHNLNEEHTDNDSVSDESRRVESDVSDKASIEEPSDAVNGDTESSEVSDYGKAVNNDITEGPNEVPHDSTPSSVHSPKKHRLRDLVRKHIKKLRRDNADIMRPLDYKESVNVVDPVKKIENIDTTAPKSTVVVKEEIKTGTDNLKETILTDDDEIIIDNIATRSNHTTPPKHSNHYRKYVIYASVWLITALLTARYYFGLKYYRQRREVLAVEL